MKEKMIMRKMTQVVILLSVMGFSLNSYAERGESQRTERGEGAKSSLFSFGEKGRSEGKQQNKIVRRKKTHSYSNNASRSSTGRKNIFSGINLSSRQKNKIRKIYQNYSNSLHASATQNNQNATYGMITGSVSDAQAKKFAETSANSAKNKILARFKLQKRIWNEVLTNNQKQIIRNRINN